MKPIKGIRLLTAVLLLFFAVFGSTAFAQEKLTYWVLYEMARMEMDRGEYGRALYLFNQVLDLKPVNPEVEMALGDIFRFEGESSLAIKQYEKALSEKEAFPVSDDKYILLYKLADLYKMDARYKEWEATLISIIEEDQAYYTDIFKLNRNLYLDKYLEKGLNKVLELYRLEKQPTVQAHRELGEFYYKYSRQGPSNPDAMVHTLFSVIMILSDGIAEYLRIDPFFQFSNLDEFFRLISKLEKISGYFDSASLYKHLYYLGVSSYASGWESRAREVWTVLQETEHSGRYGVLAGKQLGSPWIDKPPQ